MRYYTNECVDCGLSCLHEGCPYYNVENFKCDFCGEENITLYHYDDSEICGDCLLKEFEIVEGSDDL